LSDRQLGFQPAVPSMQAHVQTPFCQDVYNSEH